MGRWHHPELATDEQMQTLRRLVEQTGDWVPVFDEHDYPAALEQPGYTFDITEP
jgi:hypothetical protein